jgi:hypothetical protein
VLVPTSVRTWIAASRGSRERLATLVRTLSPNQLRTQSCCGDWIVTQVPSHIGIQVQVAFECLTAVLHGA